MTNIYMESKHTLFVYVSQQAPPVALAQLESGWNYSYDNFTYIFI